MLVKIILQLPMIYLFQVYGSFISTTIGLMVMLYFFYRRIDRVVGINEKVLIKDIVVISCISLVMGIIVSLVEMLLGRFIPVTSYLSSLVHLILAGGAGVLVFIYLTLKTRQLDRLIGRRAQRLRKQFKVS